MESWVSLLIQVPLVGVFIYYSLKTNERHQVFIEKIQERFQESQEKRDTAYLSALSQITMRMDQHNIDFAQAVARMEERTRPRKEN